MTNDMKQGRQSGAGDWVKILAAVGVVLLGGLIYLLIGSIFSGIGVPMWVSGIIAAVIIVPLTLLFVPTVDVVRVSLYRLRHHKPLFDADKNHIHHKLMRTGLSQHQTLAVILGIAICYTAMNSLLYSVLSLTVIIIIDIAFYCLVNYGINLKMKKV